MLTLYFSGTGNTEYIANLFSRKMDAKCLSIEADADFASEIKSHDTIAFCYPIYCSRAPLIMRQFIGRHMASFEGKKIIILVTQLIFSGDGARVLCDLFPENYIDVIYAEHFKFPNNLNNFLFRKISDKSIRKQFDRAAVKMDKVCRDIKSGIVRKRGFSLVGRLGGKIQGIPWQGNNTGNTNANKNTFEYKIQKNGVKIYDDCISCGICVKTCPMKNLKNEQGSITHNNNCTACYRCANICPKQAIAIVFRTRPKWQYKSPLTKNE